MARAGSDKTDREIEGTKAPEPGHQRWRARTDRMVSGVRRTSWRQRIFLAVLAIVVVGAAATAIAVARLPDLQTLTAQSADRLAFQDVNGDPLVMRGGGLANHAPLDQMPQHLIDAVLAIEDRRFYDHAGIDYRAVGRALFANAAAGRVVQGGSTISQQLIKVRYLSPERTLRRKLHEAFLTRELEETFSKDQILERYVNSVYLGQGATGMPAAARAYFDKDVADLSLAESAALAAIIRAPSVVNPYADPEALRARAGLVLSRMVDYGMVEAGEANAARVEIAVMEPRTGRPPYGGWFADWALPRAQQMAEDFDGLVTIRTTLDPRLQKLGEQVVGEGLAGQPIEAALVALRPDGTVAAMVGGKDYRTSQFNRATQALRPPGSTFKTFVYLEALASGLTPDDRIPDRPVDIDGYTPQNFNGKHLGEVTVADALAQSVNAATVELAAGLGFDRVAATARALGINAELSETPSLALGASGVTLIDMTEAYAAIATGRAPIDARGLAGIQTGPDGTYYPFSWTEPENTPEVARLMRHRDTLTGMLRRVVTDGTGSRAETPQGAVGKTGTSQDNRDALFIGWSGDLIVGVWVGNDDNSPMDEVTGGGLPAQIWSAFQTAAAEPARTAPAPAPEAVARAAPADPADEPAEAPERPAEAEVTRAESLPSPQDLAAKLEAALGRAREPTASCNIEVCERKYRSFRASDCTFQPYGGGPRKLCTR